MNMTSLRTLSATGALAMLYASSVLAQTTEPAQAIGLGSWQTEPVFTIGETTAAGYTPPGIPDGMGAFDRGDTVQILSNHELSADDGYPYLLASGAMLTGARISSLSFAKDSRKLVNVTPAFDRIFNRAGQLVDDAADLEFSGLNRLCSAVSFRAGQAGFVDDIFLTGEETYGGTEFALDVATGTLWAVPWMGRAAWESVAALELPAINDAHVALLIGDDRGDAPLLLYVGDKQAGGNFLERNGLARGRLYMWVAESGDLSPADWNGTGTTRSGRFVEVVNYDPARAGSASSQGEPGFDELGFATQAELDAQKATLGAFNFSRPEDLHGNPAPGQGGQAIFASTGRNTALNQGADLWGTTYLVEAKLSKGRILTGNIPADIRIVYDGDDAGLQFAAPDFGIRSPDNLVWADDGLVYVQEDRSVSGFGAVSGEEASIWQLDPKTGAVTRIAQVDRSAVPTGQTDGAPLDLGNWETSGVIDVTRDFGLQGERLLFINVQAHSLAGGAIDAENLDQGGQYLFLSVPETR
jgi:hypothetical protein